MKDNLMTIIMNLIEEENDACSRYMDMNTGDKQRKRDRQLKVDAYVRVLHEIKRL